MNIKISKSIRFCCIVVILTGLLLVAHAFSVDSADMPESGQQVKEMPVLTGESWRQLQPDTKIAFIWGIGHVVSVEEHVVQRHPEMQRQDFVAKLAEGLRGVPMSSIVERVDNYYRQNPDDLDQPVLSVIWSEVVRPRLKTGIADLPFQDEPAINP